MSAKAIENKLEANVKKQESNEALEGIIGDYERRLRDMEEKQNKEKTNSDKLLKVISDLQNQKALLLSKLVTINTQKIRGSVEKKTQAYQIDKRPLILYKGVGLIMVS